jgi:hypothetical protein
MKLERLTNPPRAKVSRSNFMFRGASTPDVETTSLAAEHEIRRTDLSFHAAAFRDNSCDEDA